MNKERFWQLINEAREACKDNIEGMATELENKLYDLSLKEVKQFSAIFDTYHKAAYGNGMASIANLMNHEMLTDDGFIDFRNWLIAQGKDVYMQSMKNPEILAEKVEQDIRGWYEFEALGYVGNRVIENMTGDLKQIFVNLSDTVQNSLEIISEIEFGEFFNKEMSIEEIKERFPRLAETFIKKSEA